MTARSSFRIPLAAVAIVFFATGCERDLDPLGPAPFPSDAGVFLDGFAPGLSYQAFLGSKVDALEVDEEESLRGTASLKLTIPGPTDPAGGFAGGAFVSTVPRDLSGYNALTFWAKASTAALFNLGGLGNDNTGTSKFTATWGDIPLSTTWTKYVIPIPMPSKLTEERGLFYFAEGSDFPVGYEVWIDEIQYENVGTIASEQPSLVTQTIDGEVGATLTIQGTQVTYDVAGSLQIIDASPDYFTFSSSNPSVATVDESGLIQIVGSGSAIITAKLGSVDASGAVTVNGRMPPGVAAPTPDRPSEKVVSLFSDAYTNVPVDTWSADWDMADVSDVQILGDNVKRYSNLVFAGIDFSSQTVDASAMAYLHLDLWTEDASQFKIKLVDFGADGAFEGGDDSEYELTLTGGDGSALEARSPAASVPPLTTGAWNTLDIPMSDFTGLNARGHLAQMILSGGSSTIYVDNIYFFNEAPTAPAEPAPTPALPAENVVSMFSNAYTNVPVDTWSAGWDAADVADTQIAGNDNKLYTGLVFAGIEATSQPIDASAMTRFHMDFWTPDPTAAPAVFKVKLVDFGADGAFGGGDDVEHELTFDATTAPALATGSWVALDVPLSEFAGLTTTGHIAQMIISGDPNTVYLDNIYFYNPGGGGGGSGVIDFEPGGLGASWTWNVFENVDNPPLQFVTNPDPSGVNTSATVAMFTARQAGQPFAGTQTLGEETFTLDASNAIVRIMVYKSVLSDVGIKFEQGSASTGEIKVANTVVNQWEELTFDFSGVIGPINTNITGLVVFPDFQGGRASDNIVYFDNISFAPVGGGGSMTPTTPAPTPTVPAENVVSMFSNAYTNVPVDTWSAEWDAADVADVQIAGNDNKLYTGLVFAGIEATSQPIDASAMTRFHMDFWTPDPTAAPAVFKVKLVDFGADGAFGGGDDVEHELTFDATTVPALATGNWVALDVPLSEFAGLTTTGHIAQMIISGDPNTVYLDNIYFYNPGGGGGGAGVIDFEPGGLGASWTWNVFENVDNPPLQFVTNPDPSGVNTSATVAMFTARQAGQPFAGTQTLGKETFTLDASNAIVRIMVYKSVLSDVGIKFEQGSASTGEIKVANTVVNQWEELTFDFSGVIGPINTNITGLVVFPDFQGGRASDNIVYFDNISFAPVGG